MIRLAILVLSVVVVGIVGSAASPSWAGLVSTFPSMSTVMLAVTHLEEGPTAASQIARTLPPANLSTFVFLAAFRFGCPVLGLGWGTFCGYVAALTNLAAIELISRRVASRGSVPARYRQPESQAPSGRVHANRAGIRIDVRSAPRQFGRLSPARRRRFAPLVETLPC
jgi:hypothetical protein